MKAGWLITKDHFYSLWVAGDKGGTDVISRDDKLVDALYHVAKHIKTGEIFA